ncbi:site-specific integrase [Hymenobacter sp. BT18]|uniref:tyrosine-type recombinase/integrase n=1 Tax=Hymenobacter sp. BT18 TaxID=2835648 RepID=UPI00143ECD74|nr:site-specific integrase [Hymenobacter sp. BT18]QIX62293.1 site-specific integrase [Hymenobacter sp. BT18]
MATVSFHLKRPDAVIPTAIIALVTFPGHRVKVYSGRSILPKQWVKAEQRALERGYQQNGLLNDQLDLLQKRLQHYCDEQAALGLLPTAEALKSLATLEEPTAPAPVSVKKSFADYYTEWVKLTLSRGKVGTARAGNTTLRHLLEFEQAEGYAVDFDTITPVFADAYTAYLLGPANLTDNTIAKHIDRLRRFMRYAVDRGYTAARGWEKMKWKRQEPDIMTLTAEEVEALENLALLAGGYLDNARALFLLSCYTGLRFSDLVSIRTEHVRGNTLRLTTQKTRETISIPIQARALEIITRYLAGEVRPISNQKLNDYLKELGQLAGIDSPIEVIKYRGGNRSSETVAKWERLGCHTARRTFVTLSLERGLRPELVMKLTGHRTWRAFQRYVNITEQTVAREFAKAYEMPAPKK